MTFVTRVFQRLKPDKQKQVFEAAVEEFSEKGYSQASMNTLAKNAGISKGSIFQYFTSKESLFDYVIGIATEQIKNHLKHIREEVASEDFFARMERFLMAGFGFIQKHPHLARIYFRMLQSGDAPFSSRRIQKLNKKAQSFLLDLIKEGVERGELRADLDIEKTAYILDILFNNLLQSYYTEFLAPGLHLYQANDDKLRQWTQAVSDFIRHGLAR